MCGPAGMTGSAGKRLDVNEQSRGVHMQRARCHNGARMCACGTILRSRVENHARERWRRETLSNCGQRREKSGRRIQVLPELQSAEGDWHVWPRCVPRTRHTDTTLWPYRPGRVSVVMAVVVPGLKSRDTSRCAERFPRTITVGPLVKYPYMRGYSTSSTPTRLSTT